MDLHLQTLVDLKLERTAKALKKNQFDAHIIRSREELFATLRTYIPNGTSCSVGGSMTLQQTGILDFLKNGDFQYIDRYAEGADPHQVYHDALSCQVYLMSSNAVTEEGELLNMDGMGNRVAALIYGPEKVIVIAGYNKIVRTLEEARERNRRIAAPANARRLNLDMLPCFHTGTCMNCKTPGHFCSNEVISHYQMRPGRVVVLLMNESLGY